MSFSKRQIEIIEAATKLVGDKGIQNLTTKNLAAEMGFTEPALYRHFKGKTEILASVLNYYREGLQKGIKQIIDSDSSGIQKLETIMDFQFNTFSNNPAIVMVIFAETSFQYEKVLSEAVLKILTQKKKMIEEIIVFGQKDGSVRNDVNASYLASTFMGSMRFTILRWRLSNYNFNLIEEGVSLWSSTFKLLSVQKKVTNNTYL